LIPTYSGVNCRWLGGCVRCAGPYRRRWQRASGASQAGGSGRQRAGSCGGRGGERSKLPSYPYENRRFVHSWCTVFRRKALAEIIFSWNSEVRVGNAFRLHGRYLETL